MKTRRQRNVSVNPQMITVRNTRSKTSFSIPVDLLIEIFSRLPLKSLATCRCVSKLWSWILTSPDFTELFLTISSTRPQILVSCEVNNDDLAFFSLPQSSQTSPVSSLNQLARFENRFDLNSLVSVQGLVCMVNGKNQRVAVICNPSTGQALALPKVKSRRAKIRYLFGYDPIGKLFKVLSMTTRTRNAGRSWKECEEHQVMTLGNGKMSWRMIECCVPPHSYYPHDEICIDGVLYYKSMNRSIDSYQIVCFEVRSEKFSLVNVDEPLHMAVWMGTLVNYNGKLGLLKSNASSLDYQATHFKLWVLEDVEKQEWSEHLYEFPASWENMVGTCLVYFVGVTRTNEVVLTSYQTSTHPLYHFYFNLETKNIARVEIQGVDYKSKCRARHTFINHVANVKLL